MNLYLYFKAPAIQSYALPGWAKRKGRQLIFAIRKTNAPIEEQEKLIGQMIHDLHQPQANETLLEQIPAKVAGLKQKYAASSFGAGRELADFLLFAPCWIGLYQTLFIQGLEQHNLLAAMPFGLENIAQTIGAYVVVKILIECLLRFEGGWKRWLGLGSLFVLYLSVMGVARFLPGKLYVSPISVILLSGIVFFLGFELHRKLFGAVRQKERVI
ncbi:hypothetical protein AAK899_04960 [Erysipelotrichaceae bacterium 51-3]